LKDIPDKLSVLSVDCADAYKEAMARFKLSPFVNPFVLDNLCFSTGRLDKERTDKLGDKEG
jgi:hypothetical protein